MSHEIYSSSGNTTDRLEEQSRNDPIAAFVKPMVTKEQMLILNSASEDSNGRSEARGEAFCKILEKELGSMSTPARIVAKAAARRGNGNETLQVYFGRWMDADKHFTCPIDEEHSVIERLGHAGYEEADLPQEVVIRAVVEVAQGSAIAKRRMRHLPEEQLEKEIREVLDEHLDW